MSKAGAEWKEMSSQDKEPYETKAKNDKERATRQKKEYEELGFFYDDDGNKVEPKEKKDKKATKKSSKSKSAKPAKKAPAKSKKGQKKEETEEEESDDSDANVPI